MANVFSTAGNVGSSELKYTSNGDPVLQFSVAESKAKDKTLWWRCEWFGQRGEKMAEYIQKGSSITVYGELDEDSWQDGQGVTQKRMKVRVNNVTLQGGKRGDD